MKYIKIPLIVFCLIIFTSCYEGKDLKLPSKDENIIIQIEYGDYYKILADLDEINEIFELLSDAKNTNIESIKDFPHSTDNISISFIKNENNQTYYIYEENSKYYLELPYNGIWELDEEKYNTIKNYFAETEKAKLHNSKARDEFRKFYSRNRDNEINGDKFKEFVELAFELSYEDALSLGLGKSYIIDNNVAYIGSGFSFGFDTETGKLNLLSFNNEFKGAYIGKDVAEVKKDFGEATIEVDFSLNYEINDKTYIFTLGREYYNEDTVTITGILR